MAQSTTDASLEIRRLEKNSDHSPWLKPDLLSQLPAEILLEIARQLPCSAISCLSRCSRRLYAVVDSTTYRTAVNKSKDRSLRILGSNIFTLLSWAVSSPSQDQWRVSAAEKYLKAGGGGRHKLGNIDWMLPQIQEMLFRVYDEHKKIHQARKILWTQLVVRYTQPSMEEVGIWNALLKRAWNVVLLKNAWNDFHPKTTLKLTKILLDAGAQLQGLLTKLGFAQLLGDLCQVQNLSGPLHNQSEEPFLGHLLAWRYQLDSTPKVLAKARKTRRDKDKARRTRQDKDKSRYVVFSARRPIHFRLLAEAGVNVSIMVKGTTITVLHRLLAMAVPKPNDVTKSSLGWYMKRNFRVLRSDPDIRSDDQTCAAVTAILNHGGEELVNKGDETLNMTPLLLALLNQPTNSELVGILLQAGANPNEQFDIDRLPLRHAPPEWFMGDARGSYPMNMAICHAWTTQDIIDLLVAYGADPTLEEADGSTALDLNASLGNRFLLA